MNWGLKVIPTYSLASAVYCDAACELLAEIRQQTIDETNLYTTGGYLEPDIWHYTNNLQDIITPFLHLFVWSSFLVMIEKDLFGWIRFRPNKAISQEAKNLDSDVVQEALRVKKLAQDDHNSEAI